MKPVYRQSELYHYFDCPRRFQLCREKKYVPTSTKMDEGSLFEALVLGEKEADLIGGLSGKKRKKTLDSYARSVDVVKGIFGNGVAYHKYKYEVADWILQGEADFVGQINYNGQPLNCIADLKFTSCISRIWMEKTSRRDFLQVATYQYLHFKATGEELPFIYVVVENIKDLPDGCEPLIKKYAFPFNPAVLEWIESLINTVHGDVFLEPNSNACYSGNWGQRCRYFLHCQDGRKSLEMPVEIDFMELSE